MFGVMRKRHRLPEQDQGSEQPGRKSFTVQMHIDNKYRVLTNQVKKNKGTPEFPLISDKIYGVRVKSHPICSPWVST